LDVPQAHDLCTVFCDTWIQRGDGPTVSTEMLPSPSFPPPHAATIPPRGRQPRWPHPPADMKAAARFLTPPSSATARWPPSASAPPVPAAPEPPEAPAAATADKALPSAVKVMSGSRSSRDNPPASSPPGPRPRPVGSPPRAAAALALPPPPRSSWVAAQREGGVTFIYAAVSQSTEATTTTSGSRYGCRSFT
jgi:hypothetical protein